MMCRHGSSVGDDLSPPCFLCRIEELEAENAALKAERKGVIVRLNGNNVCKSGDSEMKILIDAAKQALDAFHFDATNVEKDAAYNNLRAAIEQAEKAEPVCFVGSWWNGNKGFDLYGFTKTRPDPDTPLYTHPAPIPEGWLLVPKEPTEEMVMAAYYPEFNYEKRFEMYKAMLAAAPKEPT